MGQVKSMMMPHLLKERIHLYLLGSRAGTQNRQKIASGLTKIQGLSNPLVRCEIPQLTIGREILEGAKGINDLVVSRKLM